MHVAALDQRRPGAGVPRLREPDCRFVAIDLVAAVLDGDYPAVTQTAGREVLIGLLGIVHLVHQVRAAAQGFQILRRLR